MGFRFHKGLSLLPGVRLNLSKSGPSLSLGPKGARLNLGSRGVRTTVGLPGTGISHVSQKSWGALSRPGPAAPPGAAQDARLPDVPEGDSRTAFVQHLAALPLAELERQKRAFEDHVTAHPGQVEEGRIALLRQLFDDEIDRRKIAVASEFASPGMEPVGPGVAEGGFQRTSPVLARLMIGLLALVAITLLILAWAGVIQ